MNIAILVARLPPEGVGGAERQACQIAGRLAATHSVHVFTRSSAIPPELAAKPHCRVSRRCHVDVPIVRFAADILETLLHLGRARKQIDVIVAYQTVIDGLIAVVAKMLFGIPVIVAIRADTEYRLDQFFQSRLLSPFVFTRADFLAVQSPLLGTELVRAFERAGRPPGPEELRRKLFVLPNGITPVVPRQGRGSGVLYIGRLSTTKGVDVLIAAMRHCLHEQLTIIGDGPERATLEQSASQLSNVRFLGRLPHARVQEYLAQARVLALASHYEGQPNVLMEAMSLGVPIVATRVGGVPDLIEDRETGVLTEPGDSLAIARGIEKISTDESFSARLVANALVAIRRHEWPIVLHTLEQQLALLRAAQASGLNRGNFRPLSGSQ